MFYVFKKVRVHVLVHPDDINRTHQQIFQITLKTYYKEQTGLHFHTHVYIACIRLLAS